MGQQLRAQSPALILRANTDIQHLSCIQYCRDYGVAKHYIGIALSIDLSIDLSIIEHQTTVLLKTLLKLYTTPGRWRCL